MTDQLEEAFPKHSWNLDTYSGGFTVMGGKGGISFSWQELLRGARELEALAGEFQRISRELGDATTELTRLQRLFTLPLHTVKVVAAATTAHHQVRRQQAEFNGLVEKVNTAYTRYMANEERVNRSFKLTTRAGVDGEGHPTLVPQVSEVDTGWHWEDEVTAALLALGIMKFNAFEIGPISTTLLQPANGDRTVENYDASLSGLLRRTGELGMVNGEPVEGVIEVSALAVVGQPDRYVVTIPGVQTWNPYDTKHPLDLTGTLAAIAQTPYMSRAVTEALQQAGASAGADVMLVGHSGGGLHARAVAANPAFLAEFDPKYVVTAGSPVGNTPLPDQTVGLNLQQKWDPVPGLDGREAPDKPNNVTIEFQTPALDKPFNDAPIDGHEIYNYAHKGQLLETSDHASVAPVVAGMAAFAPKGASVSSYKFKLARKGDDEDKRAPQKFVDHPDYKSAKER